MTGQDFWYEPVDLLSRCSLNEGLLWAWADRVPVNNVYREENAFASLQDWECERLNIPPVPEGVRRSAHYLTERRLRLRESRFKNIPKYIREENVREGMEQAEAVKQWLPLIASAMEVPAAELFLKLRHGQIEATGKLLPDGVEIIDFVEDHNSYSRGKFDDLSDIVIPPDHWTMPGIDWLSNALTAKGKCYCDVSMSVEALMSQYPGQRAPVDGAELVGEYLVVKEPSAGNIPQPPKKPLGRPPTFAWDAFHVEVANLIKSGQMAEKKEAGHSADVELVRKHAGGTKAKPLGSFGKAHTLLSKILLRQELGLHRAACLQ